MLNALVRQLRELPFAAPVDDRVGDDAAHGVAHQAARDSVMRLNLSGYAHQKLDQIAIEIRERDVEAVHRANPAVPFHALYVVSEPALLIDSPGVARAAASGQPGIRRALA